MELLLRGANPHQPMRDGRTPATLFPEIERMATGHASSSLNRRKVASPPEKRRLYEAAS